MWTYPLVPEDDLSVQASLSGSFWPRVYGGAALVLDYVRGGAQGEKQLLRALTDVRDAQSRFTSPYFRRVRWSLVSLLHSREGPAHPLLVGGGWDVGPQDDGVVYRVGDSVDSYVAYSLPEGLTGGLFLANAVTAPTVLLTEGLGFAVDREHGQLVFQSSPFGNPLLSAAPPPDDPSDLRIDMWLFQSDHDADLVYRHLGYQVGLKTASGPAERDLINAVLDCVIVGSTAGGLRRFLDVLADSPRAAHDETVIDVWEEADRKLVVTDKSVYRLGKGAVIGPAVGDLLRAGDYLADAAVLYELGRGVVPPLDELTVPAELLAPGVGGPLTFGAAETALVVSSEGGLTRLDWDLGGEAAHVEAFFDELHARGLAAGESLANHLDRRPQPATGEPDALNLPTTISPLELLCENVLRGNAMVAVFRPGSFGPAALGLDHLWALRKIVPPHAALLTVIL